MKEEFDGSDKWKYWPTCTGDEEVAEVDQNQSHTKSRILKRA